MLVVVITCENYRMVTLCIQTTYYHNQYALYAYIGILIIQAVMNR